MLKTGKFGIGEPAGATDSINKLKKNPAWDKLFAKLCINSFKPFCKVVKKNQINKSMLSTNSADFLKNR